jgi:1-phosphofructokinase family hexose kinase
VSIGGSLPRGVAVDAYATLGAIAKEKGAKVMIDADGEVLAKALSCRPDFIKPNQNEASRLLNRPVDTTDEAIAAARELLKLLADGGLVVVSRGAKGAVMASGTNAWVGRSPDVEVKSTMGSGDSMIAGILWALEEGKPVEEAFRWGLACGAATASTDGTKIARRTTIIELFEQAKIEPA